MFIILKVLKVKFNIHYMISILYNVFVCIHHSCLFAILLLNECFQFHILKRKCLCDFFSLFFSVPSIYFLSSGMIFLITLVLFCIIVSFCHLIYCFCCACLVWFSERSYLKTYNRFKQWKYSLHILIFYDNYKIIITIFYKL